MIRKFLPTVVLSVLLLSSASASSASIELQDWEWRLRQAWNFIWEYDLEESTDARECEALSGSQEQFTRCLETVVAIAVAAGAEPRLRHWRY